MLSIESQKSAVELQFTDIAVRTRRALLPYIVYGNSALTGTQLNIFELQ